MQVNFERPTFVNGQLADSRPKLSLSKLNELVAQQSRVLISANGAGDYTFEIEGEEGVFTVTFTAAAETTLQIVQALQADAEANPELLNVATFLAVDDTTDYLRIDFVHPGRSYTIRIVSAPGGVLSHSLTTQAGGTDVVVGTAVVRGSSDRLAVAPGAASQDSDCLGVAFRGANVLLRDTAAQNTEDRYEPGETMDVLERGSVIVNCETPWNDGDSVFVRRVATGTQVLGALRASGDGTQRVLTGTPTAVNDQQYNLRLDVDVDGNGSYKSYVLGALADGGTNATEICDSFRASLAAIPGLAGVVVGSGTATLILTGAAGVDFELTDLGPGVVAVAETEAGTFETFRMSGAKFEGSGAVTGLAKVVLNRS